MDNKIEVILKNAKLYYQFARERLRSQETLNVEYDTKVNRTLTLAVALGSIGVLIVNLSGSSLPQNLWMSVSTGVLLLTFAAIAWCSVMGRRLSNWHRGPSERSFAGYVHQLDERILQQWVNDSYSRALRFNDATLSNKSKWVGYAQYILFVEVLALIVLGVTCCWT